METGITVPRLWGPDPGGRHGSFSSPCCGVGGQGWPTGLGVVHHRIAAPVPGAGRPAY